MSKAKRITHSLRIDDREFVVIKAKHWQAFLDAAFPEQPEAAEMGGSCGTFCTDACSQDGGCKRSFGSSGSCGAICDNGQVYLEV